MHNKLLIVTVYRQHGRYMAVSDKSQDLWTLNAKQVKSVY